MATERNSATGVVLAADELAGHAQDLCVPERAGANARAARVIESDETGKR